MVLINGRECIEIDDALVEKDWAIPPIDDKHTHNAVMVAPFTLKHGQKPQMFVYRWGAVQCGGHTVWGWEPLFPLHQNEGNDFWSLLGEIRKDLGI